MEADSLKDTTNRTTDNLLTSYPKGSHRQTVCMEKKYKLLKIALKTSDDFYHKFVYF